MTRQVEAVLLVSEPPRQQSRAKRERNGLSRRDRWILVGTIIPALVWLLAVQGYPLAYSLYLSFQHWSLADSEVPQGFAGLANFTDVLGDEHFRQALVLSAVFVLSVPVEIAIGFGLALCTVGSTLWMRITRTVLLVPMIVAPIAVGAMWRLLLDTKSGLVNAALGSVGLHGVDWLGGSATSEISVIAVDIWEWVPFSMIIFSAAINSIDQGILDSAEVDGVTRWQNIRHIVMPMVMPSTLLIMVFRIIDALLVIDVVFSLTFGGPGFSTNTATLWIYNQGLRYFNIGQAAAASWILLIVCVLLALVILRLKNRAERSLSGEGK